MKISNSEDVQAFIVGVEQRFPINEWKYNNIHVWPLIRISLEYFLYDQINTFDLNKSDQLFFEEARPQSSLINKLKKQSGKFFSVFLFYYWYLKLKRNKDFLFLSATHYRSTVSNVSVNKFFDVLIEKYNLKSTSSYIEKPDNKQTGKVKYADLNINFYSGLKHYLRYQNLKKNLGFPKNNGVLELNKYDQFIDYLQAHDETVRFANSYSKNKIQATLNEWYSFYRLAKMVLQKLKVKKVFSLCYFDKIRMAFIAAANLKSIPVIEMQHGPLQSLAYSNWTRLPKSGYELLPNTFWCWDMTSKEVIESWAANSEYTAFVGGNPWISYWKSKQEEYPHNNYILYTLQAQDARKNFPDSLITCIKELKIKWFVRLHPNWYFKKGELVDFLEEKGILDLINIESATRDPLPVLLENSLFHVTNYSGSIIEAEQLGIFTVLLDHWGEQMYSDYIGRESAVYLNPTDEGFIHRFCKLTLDIDQYEIRYPGSDIDFSKCDSVFDMRHV